MERENSTDAGLFAHQNPALVADLTLEPSRVQRHHRRNRAGKSILIGALNLVLGERADHFSAAAESCAVEAVFDITGLPVALKDYLADHGLESVRKPAIDAQARVHCHRHDRQFVNGSPRSAFWLLWVNGWWTSTAARSSVAAASARQLATDAFGGLEKIAKRLRTGRRAGLSRNTALGGEEQARQQLDLLRFQVQEIEAAALQPGEEALIEPEFHRANNAAKLLQFSQAALEVLAESEDAIVTRMGIVGRTLQELQRVDPSAASLGELHAQAVEILRELQEAISRYGSQVEVEPARLAELEERLDLLHSLKRKYGATVDAVLAFGAQARQRLQRLESRDAERERLQAALAQLDKEILHAGKKLSAARKQVIPRLAQAAGRQLADLGFRQGQFEVAIHSATQLPPDATALSPSGLDTIEFLFAPNPGEPARPLRAIASSGEMARVMLALKTVLAAEDEIPVLVFDEVDANVGGETAHAVGEKMKQIAAQRQVICITHLPQVAAPADAHYVVTKRVQAGRTVTEIARLERKERVTELARMLGGQSEAARKHAAALLKTGATPSV